MPKKYVSDQVMARKSIDAIVRKYNAMQNQ